MDDDIHTWRNKQKGKYSLEWLFVHTRIRTQEEAEKLVGQREADCLYTISSDTFKSLPHRRWITAALHPLLNLIAFSISISGIALSIIHGEPLWGLLACPFGYLVFRAVWYLTRPDDDDIDASFDEIEKLIENQDFAGALKANQNLYVREVRQNENDNSNTPLQKLFFGWFWKRWLRNAQKLEKDIDSLITKLVNLRNQNAQMLTKVRWEIASLDDSNDKHALAELEQIEKKIESAITELDAIVEEYRKKYKKQA